MSTQALAAVVDGLFGGVTITLGFKSSDGDAQVMRIQPDGHPELERVDMHTLTQPTLRLDGEFARALLDALLRHYEGASDMHTVRQDLLHERRRVDKLTGALIDMAHDLAQHRC